MPVSRNRKSQKKKAQARRNEIQARRKNVKKWVAELETAFETLQPPAPTHSHPQGGGIMLTPTPDIKEIVQHYDNLEI
jgi:hypothetical protein